jgi:thymidylate kinase
MSNNGLLIVIESTDKSGKTTICNKLIEYYNNKNIKNTYIKLPNRNGKYGEIIDKYLKNEIELTNETIYKIFISNRKYEIKKIKKLLNQNEIVICDRYIISGIVYNYYNNYKNEILNTFYIPNKNKIIELWNNEINYIIQPNYIFLIKGNYDRTDEIDEKYDNINIKNKLYSLFKNIFKILNINYYEIDNTKLLDDSIKNILNILNI